jgi:hypothetical protein
MGSPSPSAAGDDAGLSIEGLVVANGHRPAVDLAAFGRLAASAQAARKREGTSPHAEVTRSTALWAAMRFDEGLQGALESRHLSEADLRAVIGLEGVGVTAGSEPDQVDRDLHRALWTYLAARPGPGRIGVEHVVLAILEDVRAVGRGRLPGRLQSLGADVDELVVVVQRLAAARAAVERPNVEDYFADDVQAVVHQITGNPEITAARLAIELHPALTGHAASGSAAKSVVDPDAGRRETVGDWLRQVVPLYDVAEVESSAHGFIDADLTLLALAELEPLLAADDGWLHELAVIRTGTSLRPHRRARETRWRSDEPTGPDGDRLNRRRLALELTRRIRELVAPGDGDDTSFLMLVDAPWGTGKSSLFRCMEADLRTEPEQFLVVRVNAWREQRCGVQWWTLLNSLQTAMADEATSRRRRLRLRWAVRRERLLARWASLVVAVLVILAVAGALVVVGARSAGGAESWFKFAALVTTLFAAVFGVIQYVAPSSARAQRNLVERSDDPTHEVSRLFSRTLRRARRNVVYLIDDLDRCDEDYVVEFLEVVQTLVREAPRARPTDGGVAPPSGLCLVVAADSAWIRTSYEKHYATFAGTGQPGRPLGYLFLEKLFQVQVRLQVPSALLGRDFMSSLLRMDDEARGEVDVEREEAVAAKAGIDIEEARSAFDVAEALHLADQLADPVAREKLMEAGALKLADPAMQRATQHALLDFAGLLEPNPRSMKLFVNAFGILSFLRALEGVTVPTAPLALWTIVEIRWPELALHLRGRPEAVSDQAVAAELPEPMQALLARPEVVAVVRSTRWGPLTAKRVRECAGA